MISKYNIDIIHNIIPMNSEAYLKSKGWDKIAKINSVAVIFKKTKEDGRSTEVLVPTDITCLDYKNRLADLLLTLQEFEERELTYIAKDIVSSAYDTFRIIAFKGDASASLPLTGALTLLDRGLAMMSSVAQSIITLRPYFQSKKSGEVSNFLSKLRMGHTERGSFIVTIQAPIAPSFSADLPLYETEISAVEEPFERLVMKRLCSLISEATMIANAPDENVLTASVSRGMSANFFEALADIADACGENGANFDMTWAPVRPIHTHQTIKNNFLVKKEMVETLREAGKTLKAKIPEKNIEIAGFVIALHKDKGMKYGTIKLNDTTTEKQRIITIELDDIRYKQAIDAHKTGKFVVFKGDLEKGSRVPSFTNISEMRIFDSDELSTDL
jgi:hypothetical protein